MLHYYICLRSTDPINFVAPTASAQKQDQFTLTYLNKGQHYAVAINDTLCRDHELKTTISIAFHDHSHRQIASNFWKYWICQQSDTQTARAIDLGNIGEEGGAAHCKFSLTEGIFIFIQMWPAVAD
jgi:hypothetical protein